jgi:hypothetical protein
VLIIRPLIGSASHCTSVASSHKSAVTSKAKQAGVTGGGRTMVVVPTHPGSIELQGQSSGAACSTTPRWSTVGVPQYRIAQSHGVAKEQGSEMQHFLA